MAMDMVTMVIITARGLLMLRLPPRLLLLPTMDTMVMALDMVTMVIITARGLLMLRLPLMLLLLPTMDTMAMAMDMVAMVMDTAMVMVMDTWVKLSNNLNKSSVFTALST